MCHFYHKLILLNFVLDLFSLVADLLRRVIATYIYPPEPFQCRAPAKDSIQMKEYYYNGGDLVESNIFHPSFNNAF